jgi:hypothetical protein
MASCLLSCNRYRCEHAPHRSARATGPAAQRRGFTLNEIQELLALSDRGRMATELHLLDRVLMRVDRSRLVSGRTEPGGQGLTEACSGSVAHPGHVSVGADQHGLGSRDRAEYRKL